MKKIQIKENFILSKQIKKSILVEDIINQNYSKIVSFNKLEKINEMVRYNLMWGRPLRSIFARFNNKKLTFKFNHLETTDYILQNKIYYLKKNKRF